MIMGLKNREGRDVDSIAMYWWLPSDGGYFALSSMSRGAGVEWSFVSHRHGNNTGMN
jgi:hypothetical protein